jgi:glycosyltransferase involved in cell wall biosynthesis
LKIAVVIHSLGSGGAERISTYLSNYWHSKGVEMHLITIAESEADFFALHPGVNRHSLALASSSINLKQAICANYSRIRKIRKIFKVIKPDIIIGMMTGAAVLTLLGAYGLGVKVIASERTHPPSYPLGRVWELLRRWTYRWAEHVVVQSEESMNWLRQTIPSANGIVIPNPVNYPLPKGVPILAVADHVRDECKLLLAVGRLDEGKQFDLLIEAFSQVSSKLLEWDLVILGEGSERQRLQEAIMRLELSSRVTMPGKAGNIGDWYVRADLYVMSSRFEGFPNTLVEAMSHGCAAVSYDCDTGPRDIILHGVDGMLVRPVGNVDALAEAIKILMGDESRREAMGNHAIKIKERFSSEMVFGLWQSILENTE